MITTVHLAKSYFPRVSLSVCFAILLWCLAYTLCVVNTFLLLSFAYLQERKEFFSLRLQKQAGRDGSHRVQRRPDWAKMGRHGIGHGSGPEMCGSGTWVRLLPPKEHAHYYCVAAKASLI